MSDKQMSEFQTLYIFKQQASFRGPYKPPSLVVGVKVTLWLSITAELHIPGRLIHILCCLLLLLPVLLLVEAGSSSSFFTTSLLTGLYLQSFYSREVAISIASAAKGSTHKKITITVLYNVHCTYNHTYCMCFQQYILRV